MRVVDLATSLVRVLEPLAAKRPEWFFPDVLGVSGYKVIWNAQRRIALEAGLAPLGIHSLRHHYASLLLSKDVSPVYVQRQLGHAGISLTVDLYGRHMRMPRPAVLDEL
jgi:integrase